MYLICCDFNTYCYDAKQCNLNKTVNQNYSKI